MEYKAETDSLRFQTSGLRQRNKTHNIVLLTCIIINIFTYAFMIFSNFASTADIGLFPSRSENNTDVNISPAGATFATWGLIYAWTALWLIFNVVLIFLKNDNSRLYYDPPVLTIAFHVFVFVNFVFNIIWLAIWGLDLYTVSLVFLLIQVVSLTAATIISHKNTFAAEPYLMNRKWVIWLYRFLVNNGLAFFVTWITIATLLSLAITITYEWAPTDQISEYKETSSLISLSILTVVLVAYFACDVFFLEKFMRYTFSTYVQLLIGFTGILGKNWNDGQESSAVFSLVLMCIVGVMFIVKICVMIFKIFTSR